MSTILNALKRLENEDRAAAGKEIPAAMAGRASASKRNLRWRLVLTLAAVAMLAGVAVFWGAKDRASDEGASLKVAQPEPQAKTTPRVDAGVAPPTPAPIPVARRAEAIPTTAGHRDRRPSKSTTQALVNARTDLTAPTYMPPDPEGHNVSVRPAEPLPAGQAAAQVLRPSPAAPPSVQEDPYARLEVLPKELLQLQAISWSNIPAERITIISGQIMREGQNMDGYTVIEIRSNDVIVEKAGERWKLAYGSR